MQQIQAYIITFSVTVNYKTYLSLNSTVSWSMLQQHKPAILFFSIINPVKKEKKENGDRDRNHISKDRTR